MELPKVFEGKINNNLHNTQDIFYSSERGVKNVVDVDKKINNIFSSTSHVYKSRVRIELKDKEIEKVIVGMTNNNLITIDGELIKISDILDINRI